MNQRGDSKESMPTDPNTYTGIASPAGAVKNLAEEPVWEDEIYEIQAGDLLAGGEKGLANLQAQQLANRTAWLKKNAGNNKRIKNIENMVMKLYADKEAKEAESKSPSGNSGIMVETFAGDADEIDKTSVNVSSIASDRKSIKVDNPSQLAIGPFYQLGDDSASEEVRIVGIDENAEYHNVMLSSPLKNVYDAKSATLSRSNATIKNSVARCGGRTAVASSNKLDLSYCGTQIPKSCSASINLQNLAGFNVQNESIQVRIVPRYNFRRESGNFLGMAAFVYDSLSGRSQKICIDMVREYNTPASLYDIFPKVYRTRGSSSKNTKNTSDRYDYWGFRKGTAEKYTKFHSVYEQHYYEEYFYCGINTSNVYTNMTKAENEAKIINLFEKTFGSNKYETIFLYNCFLFEGGGSYLIAPSNSMVEMKTTHSNYGNWSKNYYSDEEPVPSAYKNTSGTYTGFDGTSLYQGVNLSTENIPPLSVFLNQKGM